MAASGRLIAHGTGAAARADRAARRPRVRAAGESGLAQRTRWQPLATALSLAATLAACTVGPDYVRQPAPVPQTYKELKGWKIATPRDDIDRGPWWSVFRDSKLDYLLRQVEIANQTVAAQAAAYEEARAVIREAEASLFPTVTASYSATRSHTGPGSSGVAVNTTTFTPQANLTYSPDIFGRVRRQIESDVAAAQASNATLANTKLSAEAQLAIAYFNLRASDSLRALLRQTIIDYKRTLEITQNQYQTGGLVTRADVVTAQTQLLSTQAQEINVGVQRAQFEHAIAVLSGRPPAELSIAQNPLPSIPPRVPVRIPSTLLERRPDIAAAERAMQQQNALIGVAIAGYYPDITLTGSAGFTGHIPLPFNVSNLMWALGASGTQTLFNGGLTAAQVDAARATYWQGIANYRQTVLTAFQQVEDELAAIRILSQQLQVETEAVKAGRVAVDVYLNQYRAGTVAFTTVVTAQATLLANQEAALTIRQNLFVATVTLIEALGGGWEQQLIPTQEELAKGNTLMPQL